MVRFCRMKITKIIWSVEVVDKIKQKHNVERHEVEDVIFDTTGRTRFFFVEKGHRKGEDVYTAMGRTGAGRYLIVPFIYKPDQEAGLILSAREMTETEKKRYEKK